MPNYIKSIVSDSVEAVTIGGGFSYGMASVWPEVVHGFAVFMTGVITAVAVFFVQRTLRKYFP